MVGHWNVSSHPDEGVLGALSERVSSGILFVEFILYINSVLGEELCVFSSEPSFVADIADDDNY